ncbi:DUF5462 family protein [Escherichia coli]
MRLNIRLFVITVITGMMFISLPSTAVQKNEKVMYLGVLNGVIQGNSFVKVNRTLSDPVLFKTDNISTLPAQAFIRNAEVRPASENDVYITVRQYLPEVGKDALVSVKMSLVIDGIKKTLFYSKVGNDILIKIPSAEKTVELRTDYPVELQVPANYRGNLQVTMEIEGVNKN